MKKIILILFSLLSISMVDKQTKLWQGVTIYLRVAPLKDGGTSHDRTVITEVIEAPTLFRAKQIFNAYIINSCKELKGLECTLYTVYEIKNDEVLR